MSAIQSMLAAFAPGKRVVIGQDPMAELRALSDSKRLTCPACGAPVVLKAGEILAAHFAHASGTICSHPEAEPETDSHRAGKAILAAWAAKRLPGATITVEARIEETGQRADLLIEPAEGGRIAIEFQCSDLSAREWRRRHRVYRRVEIRDLWFLGAARLRYEKGALRPSELERIMLRDCAPLLFLDPLGECFEPGKTVRFRPMGSLGRSYPAGTLSGRPLDSLAFPWKLLDWPRWMEPRSAGSSPRGGEKPLEFEGDARLWQWLRIRHHVTPENLPAFFGLPISGAESLDCSDRLWQACAYYRFIHGRVGEAWWLDETLAWARRYLPLGIGADKGLRRALWSYQMLLSAAGLLSIPTARGQARVEADFTTLLRIPDPAAAHRIAASRRALAWDRR